MDYSYITANDILRRTDCATTPEELKTMQTAGQIPEPELQILDPETEEVIETAYTPKTAERIVKKMNDNNKTKNMNEVRNVTLPTRLLVYEACKKNFNIFRDPQCSWDEIRNKVTSMLQVRVPLGVIKSSLKQAAIHKKVSMPRKQGPRKVTAKTSVTVNPISVKKNTAPTVLSTTANVEVAMEGSDIKSVTIRSLRLRVPANNA